MLRARENPEASGSWSWDLTRRSSFCFLRHIFLFVCLTQVFPMILTEESRPSEDLTRLRPSRFHTEASPCLPKFNPDPECKFSPPAPPHAWQVATSGSCQGTLPQPVLLNEFPFWQRSGCKSGQICWPS